MATKVKPMAERIRDAQERAEIALIGLFENVENYAAAQSAGGRGVVRRDILRRARQYSRAMDRLTTIRKG